MTSAQGIPMVALARRKSSRRFQFGIRTFFVAVAILGVLLAVSNAVLVPWNIDRGKIVELRKINAQVFTEPRGQFLLRQFVGDTFSQRSIYLHLDDSRVNDDWLKRLGPMQHIEVLSIKSPNVSDVGLTELTSWPNLMDLNLVDTKVTDSAIEALRKSHPKLRLIQSRQTEP